MTGRPVSRGTVWEWLVGVLDPLLERLSEWAFAEDLEEQR